MQSPGVTVGQELGRVGRARRYEAGACELWRLGSEDRALAERLASLGRSGIGGFTESGEDEAGVWLLRRVPRETLADFLRAEHEPGRVVERLLALGRVLAVLEDASLFPGPLSPKGVALVGDGVELLADSLVHTLVGEPLAPGHAADSASPRFMPPEQADGAPWDNAANRYVFGLMLYRGLALEHAFAARGLRRGLEEAAHRAPPPIADARAAKLPPGLQSYCLRLLDPDPRERPKSAAEIAARLGRFVGEETPPTRRSPEPKPSEPPAPVAPPVAGQRAAGKAPARARLRALAPVLVGLAIAAVALGGMDERPARRDEALVREPLAATESLASDCAACHPRQTGEWHRSVMAHAAKSPLYQALEILIEEQVGRDFDCPNGAGILRQSDGANACRDRASGLPVTGSGGELWCVNCHAPAENLARSLPPWDGRGPNARSRLPLADLLSEQAMEGISCGFCHQVHGPVRPSRGGYQGNPFWTSTRTGERFAMRPEDARGQFGISNSGYELDPAELFGASADDRVPGGAHARPTEAALGFLRDSRFCGTCHDVRLFGSDVIGARKGEHFKRLRNAFSEWQDYVTREARAGRKAASCQDCHMSSFPGVCETERGAPGGGGCPPGTRFAKRKPGSYPEGRWSTSSSEARRSTPHYFSGVDLPLAAEFSDDLLNEPTVDVFGIPLGARQRRQMLLENSVKLGIEGGALRGNTLELPVVFENVGGGHRVPAGFSQEREVWLHLRVTDARGRLVYEVGKVERADEDLRDKTFLRVNTDDGFRDGQGRPLGLFGADVADGPDVPRWSPNPARGGERFRGRGLVNFQNGFLRCVVCIGNVDASGRCQPLPGQERARADRYADGNYDPDTGECRSNLLGDEALLETYFPIGGLDATRGAVRGPDAIIDTRSLPPSVPIAYVYELSTAGFAPPFQIDARLLFRAFPPFLLRAFIDYEERQARRGLRPSGPSIDASALARNSIVEMARLSTVVR